jgi:hypothetical protein
MEPVNLPEVAAEVAAVLERYEDALVNNRVDVLDELFWDDPRTVRLGASENLYGIDAIREFRKARPSAGLARTIVRTEITTFGRDFAVTHREFTRSGAKPGRQTQTLVRMGAGWRIVSAHVSAQA